MSDSDSNGDAVRRQPAIPPTVHGLLDDLWAAGHAAYVVGGSLRDALLGRAPADWDLTTDARPGRIQEVFPGAVYENRYGTVVVRRDGGLYEVTTFRRDFAYADHRHPEHVEFGDSIEEDLSRRDFTVNAIAWGGPAPDRVGEVDPFGGRRDLERRLLRAVGDPAARFDEDALRMVRAVRLSATLDFEIEPATLEAICRLAELAAHLSAERIAVELNKLLGAPRPSVGLTLMAQSGLLPVLLPELAIQRGIAQNKISGGDLWDHTVRTVDAAPRERPLVRLAALLHDVGKPATAADGHFYGHDAVGARLAVEILTRLRYPKATIESAGHLVRHHMFAYEPGWTDGTVRRFIKRVGPGYVDDLLALREADNVGSGLAPDVDHLQELRRRCHEQLDARVVLRRGDLALHGDELIEELGLVRGPVVGRLIDALLERVIADQALNERSRLLELARSLREAAEHAERMEHPHAQRSDPRAPEEAGDRRSGGARAGAPESGPDGRAPDGGQGNDGGRGKDSQATNGAPAADGRR